ncbi:hypothetical protein BB559_007552 [Furculomyces boomerangus]|uniref:Uncharacterized protein n=2 Tax=Harpellales TaxID=61421 RepID=A0A2T9XWX3_9FUNG|nr:hypothetical protein BB559_007552 [Furculomyces boomerangus]PVZ98526.1 hypothetical protein BB558_005465 [Smittium angustum]
MDINTQITPSQESLTSIESPTDSPARSPSPAQSSSQATTRPGNLVKAKTLMKSGNSPTSLGPNIPVSRYLQSPEITVPNTVPPTQSIATSSSIDLYFLANRFTKDPFLTMLLYNTFKECTGSDPFSANAKNFFRVKNYLTRTYVSGFSRMNIPKARSILSTLGIATDCTFGMEFLSQDLLEVQLENEYAPYFYQLLKKYEIFKIAQQNVLRPGDRSTPEVLRNIKESFISRIRGTVGTNNKEMLRKLLSQIAKELEINN